MGWGEGRWVGVVVKGEGGEGAEGDGERTGTRLWARQDHSSASSAECTFKASSCDAMSTKCFAQAPQGKKLPMNPLHHRSSAEVREHATNLDILKISISNELRCPFRDSRTESRPWCGYSYRSCFTIQLAEGWRQVQQHHHPPGNKN